MGEELKHPKVKLKSLNNRTKRILLERLECIGKERLKADLRESLLHPLNDELIKNKEFLSRYLLLGAVLDQQAESKSARDVVVTIYDEFGIDFFSNPKEYVIKVYDVFEKIRDIYKVKSRVIRMKKEGVLLLRIGGYLLTLINIENKYRSFIKYLKSFRTPRSLLNGILNDILLGGLLYEKAARMYVGWVTHPDLYVSVYGRIPVNTIPLVINGHVCKVLARTGFLDSVLIEDKKRPIVKAEDERKNIEMLTRMYYSQGDYFMIDYGAFYVGIKYCDETQPKCNRCPINELCLKNINVRAY